MKHSIFLAVLSLTACSSDQQLDGRTSNSTHANAVFSSTVTTAGAEVSSKPASRSALLARIDAIDAAIAEWHGASTLAAAKVGAEKARNLITGSTGPGYGDLDGTARSGGKWTLVCFPASRGNPVSLRNSPTLA